MKLMRRTIAVEGKNTTEYINIISRDFLVHDQCLVSINDNNVHFASVCSSSGRRNVTCHSIVWLYYIVVCVCVFQNIDITDFTQF